MDGKGQYGELCCLMITDDHCYYGMVSPLSVGWLLNGYQKRTTALQLSIGLDNWLLDVGCKMF